ncbi:PREDICTED: ADP-ribosylation factor-like isoform X1 [Dinoponera quadriceps]|uniref:ADP-ribosylation factor-like isoform X1 n=1 Tax=Dinoponera quadriceps TaxID=609295 RepID=A0A6P3YGP0_DINQU|nr:PREDICTED: ADP-ribosylation factor-like isoform X1 [Dinoponera quadriceps]
MLIVGKYPLTEGRKTFLWISCTCIGLYMAYRYWKKRKVKIIDESFIEIFKLINKPEKKVLLIGLKGAGKTLLMNQINVLCDENFSYTVPPQPTEGSIATRLKYNKHSYTIWEIRDNQMSREIVKYWMMFLNDVDLIVFVVDSDTHKLSATASLLKELTTEPQLNNKTMLIVANKQDCPDALAPENIKQLFDFIDFSPKNKVELIGCQTEPLPCLMIGETKYKWYHSSVALVMEKMSSMAIS